MSIMTAVESPVGKVCEEILEARAAKRLTEGKCFILGRKLAVACVESANVSEAYNPEDDRRVWWARKVLAAAAGQGAERPDASLERIVMLLLGKGVEMAFAGERGAGE